MITGRTKLLGLMGRPVEHSLSPAMHNAAFAREGLDFVYVAMNVDPEELPAAVKGALALGFRGFNLTMPHKEEIIPLLDSLDGAAEVSGAVNTVVIDGSALSGYNTDGSGMAAACREAGVGIQDKTVALLGAGGAAAAISFALQSEGVGELHIFNRNPDRAEILANRLHRNGGDTKIHPHPYDSLEDSHLLPNILINTTSLGMKGEDPLPVPQNYLESLPSYVTVADAVYRPANRTRLLRAAERLGLKTIDGRRMLLYQGVHAQRLWTGLEPNVAAMDEQLPRNHEE